MTLNFSVRTGILLLPLFVASGASAQYGPAVTKTLPKQINAKYGLPKRPKLSFRSLSSEGKKGFKDSDMVTLKNGRTVRYGDYKAALDTLERKLNAYGYSLHKSETIPQASKIKTQLDQAAKSLESISHEASHQAVLLTDAPNCGVLDFQKAPPPAPILGHSNKSLKLNDHFPTRKWEGGTDDFDFYFEIGGDLTGESSFAFNNNSFSHPLSELRADAQATFGATLFGQDAKLCEASATYESSDESAKVSVGATFKILGLSIYDDHESFQVGYSANDAWTRSFDLSTPSVISIGPVDVSVKMGLRGSVGLGYSYKLFTSQLEGDIQPHVDASIYAEIDAGINAGVASADAGIEGTFLLVDDTFDIHAHAGLAITANPNFPPYLSFDRGITITNDLHAFDGELDAFLNGSVGIGSFSIGGKITKTLYSYSGLRRHDVFYDSSTTTPISMKALGL